MRGPVRGGMVAAMEIRKVVAALDAVAGSGEPDGKRAAAAFARSVRDGVLDPLREWAESLVDALDEVDPALDELEDAGAEDRPDFHGSAVSALEEVRSVLGEVVDSATLSTP